MRRTLRSALVVILLFALQACADGASVSDNGGLVQGYKGSREGVAKRAVAGALISLKQRNYGNAIALAGQAIDTGKVSGADDRLLSLAYLIRASAYLSTRALSEAEADIGQALERNPRSAFAYQQRGALHGLRGHYRRSIADYSRSIDIEPRFGPYFLRGITYLKTKQLVRARKDLTRAIAIDPNRANAFYWRGVARSVSGKRRLALSDFRKTLALDPGHRGAHAALRNQGLRRPGTPAVPRTPEEFPNATVHTISL